MSLRDSVLVMMFLFAVFFIFLVAVTSFPMLIPIIIIAGIIYGAVKGWDFGSKFDSNQDGDRDIDSHSALSEEEQKIVKDIMRESNRGDDK